MSNFKISIDDTQVKKTFSTLARGVNDFSKPLEEIGTELLDAYGNKTFDQQGATGEAWKPLSAATLMARKKRTGYYKQSPITTGKTLVWTGKLKSSFIKAVTSVKLTIENNADYFKYHQSRGGKTPQRRMLYLNKDIITLVTEKIAKYTNTLVK